MEGFRKRISGKYDRELFLKDLPNIHLCPLAASVKILDLHSFLVSIGADGWSGNMHNEGNDGGTLL